MFDDDIRIARKIVDNIEDKGIIAITGDGEYLKQIMNHLVLCDKCAKKYGSLCTDIVSHMESDKIV